MIFPAVVEESDSAIDGAGDDFFGCLLILGVTKMMAPQAERRDLNAGLAEFAFWNLTAGYHLFGIVSFYESDRGEYQLVSSPVLERGRLLYSLGTVAAARLVASVRPNCVDAVHVFGSLRNYGH